MKIERNFLLKEFTVSEEFPHIAGKMKHDSRQLANTVRLASSILQPIRNKFGMIIIESGLRNKELTLALKNKGYYPSKTSQHDFGEASDIKTPKAKLFEVFKYITNNLPYWQLILYIKKRNNKPYYSFIHVSVESYDFPNKKKKLMTRYNGKYHMLNADISWNELSILKQINF